MIDSSTIRYIKKYFLIQKIVDHADRPSASHTWGQLLAAASHLLTAVAVTTSGEGGRHQGTDQWQQTLAEMVSIMDHPRYDLISPVTVMTSHLQLSKKCSCWLVRMIILVAGSSYCGVNWALNRRKPKQRHRMGEYQKHYIFCPRNHFSVQ